MYVILHVDVIEYTICGLGISVGVEIPPLLHTCLSFDNGLHTTTRIINDVFNGCRAHGDRYAQIYLYSTQLHTLSAYSS